MRIVGAAPEATCAWVFDEGEGAPRSYTGPCREEIRIRLLYGKTTNVTVDVSNPGVPPLRATEQVVVRDLLIAGLGDSIAAGEGNRTGRSRSLMRASAFVASGPAASITGPAARPTRATAHAKPPRRRRTSCRNGRRLGARWMSQACHRSLYGYQIRTALALAVENPHVAVTFLPLACTGATIETGVLGSMRARELNCAPDKAARARCRRRSHSCRATSRPLGARGRTALSISVLLTVGANDIDFSGLVANVIIDATRKRVLFNSMMSSPESAETALTRALPRDFAKLRAALKPMVGGDLSRVVFVSYGNPALRSGRVRLRRRADGLRRPSGVQGGWRSHATRR